VSVHQSKVSLKLAIPVLALCIAGSLFAQESDPEDRVREARDLARGGSEGFGKLRPMVSDPSNKVRLEAVKSIVAIGTQHSIDPLIQATRDNDPEIQVRAVDGIVNFYLPGYLQSGMQRFGSALRSRFDQENTQIVDPYVTVREDAVVAIGRVARGGSSMESRANAARAAGILRGRAAVPDLLEALRSKDDAVMFESLIALQKIADVSAGPKVIFLLRDLQERVQIAAIETVGVLRAREATPDLLKVYNQDRSEKVRRAAIAAMAMMPSPQNKSFFEKALADDDEAIRTAAAEALARLQDPKDLPTLEKAFGEERKMPARLAVAFALVALGKTETGEFAPLTYLINTLNSRSYRGVAEAYLTELARSQNVRKPLHESLRRGTKEEKLGTGRVLAVSGDRESLRYLEALTKDPDTDVAQESLRAVRSLRAKLP
jgi:HEAT repeat protein